MKLLKLLEQERKKKSKFSHAGLLVGPPSAHEYHHRAGAYYGQRKEGLSLKRKRKQLQQPAELVYQGAAEYKQRFCRRKEAESSSD